jgi:hypothetical protein
LNLHPKARAEEDEQESERNRQRDKSRERQVSSCPLPLVGLVAPPPLVGLVGTGYMSPLPLSPPVPAIPKPKLGRWTCRG